MNGFQVQILVLTDVLKMVNDLIHLVLVIPDVTSVTHQSVKPVAEALGYSAEFFMLVIIVTFLGLNSNGSADKREGSKFHHDFKLLAAANWNSKLVRNVRLECSIRSS